MAKLAPIFNVNQLINGIPANGALLFTYANNSSTKQTTYTDAAGLTPQANPIVLDPRGEPAQPIWLAEGQTYTFVFAPSTDSDPPVSPIRTINDITGINDASLTVDQWVDSGVTPTYVNATTFTIPGDQTSAFTVNRRVKCTVTAGSVFGYIATSSYGALTTVTVVLDSGNLDAGLSSVELGIITPTNTSLPQIPDWVKASMLGDSSLGFAMINGTITATVGSNALTIAIKTKAGTDPSALDPVLICFRNATLASGDYVVRSVTAATSIVVSSGSTLGTTSGVFSSIQVLAIDNSGTVELAVVNNLGSLLLDESSVINTTAEGGAGAADSEGVVYSTTARTNVAYRNICYVLSSQATAGTWASAPTQIALYSDLPKSGWIAQANAATTSGSTVTIGSSLPIWVNEFEVQLYDASLSGTDNILIQFGLGASSGFVTSGYVSDSTTLSTTVSSDESTAGFLVRSNDAAHGFAGIVKFSRGNGNYWTCSYSLGRSSGGGSAATVVGGGYINLSGPPRSIRLSSSGSNTFDNGFAVVRYRL